MPIGTLPRNLPFDLPSGAGPGLTATLDASQAFVSLTATGLVGYSSVTVYRVQPDGALVAVRGASSYAPGGASTAAFFDYEGPLGVTFSYQLVGDGAIVATSGNITIPTLADTYWIKNLAIETLSVKVHVEKMGAVSRGARVLADSAVLGRKNPVVVTDVRGGRRGQMSLYTLDLVSATALEALFASGATLLFQAPYTYGFKDMYFVAKDLSEEWAFLAGEPTRTWSFDYIEVDSPAADLSVLSTNSWAQVVSFGTWQKVATKRSSWLQVLQQPWTTADGS